MPSIHARVGDMMNWLATSARTFGYMLPDSLELILYVSVAIYFGLEISQKA